MADEAGKEMRKNQAEYDKLSGVLTRADARIEQVDALIAMGDRAMGHLRSATWQDKRTFLYALGVVVRVKSMSDYKIDWRLEQIKEEWVQAQLCVPSD